MNRSSQTPSANQPTKGKPDKAQAILAGALQVFTTYGYAAASMDRIAAAAKVSKPTVYSYFQDKERLFVAVLQQFMNNSNQLLFTLDTIPDTQASPEAILRHMATSVLEEASHNQPFLTMMRLIIGESEQFPELAKTFVREVQKPMLTQLAGYLASQPQLHFPDPMVAARIFAGSIVHYLIIQKIMHGDDVLQLEADRMVDGLIHLMMSGGDRSPNTPPTPESP